MLTACPKEIKINEYKYRPLFEPAAKMYVEHGLQIDFDPETFNGLLVIQAPDEETADKIRMTYTDIGMWEKI